MYLIYIIIWLISCALLWIYLYSHHYGRYFCFLCIYYIIFVYMIVYFCYISIVSVFIYLYILSYISLDSVLLVYAWYPWKHLATFSSYIGYCVNLWGKLCWWWCKCDEEIWALTLSELMYDGIWIFKHWNRELKLNRTRRNFAILIYYLTLLN